jgi:hypothetical protein
MIYLSLLPLAVLLFALVCHLRRPGKPGDLGETERACDRRRRQSRVLGVQAGFDPLRGNRRRV